MRRENNSKREISVDLLFKASEGFWYHRPRVMAVRNVSFITFLY